MNSYFEGVDGILEAIAESRPDMTHVAPEENCEPRFTGRRVRWRWEGRSYVVEVAVERIAFMQDNMWNFRHGAGVLQAMRDGMCFEPPGARIYRVTAEDVKRTQAHAKRGELLYQRSMLRPWTKADIGKYKATLIDGNHRAAAAMILGEKSIPVYVGEDYRDEIRKKDWL